MDSLEGKELLDAIAAGVSASVATAWEQARRYNTPLIVWKDGRIVEIPPEELSIGDLPEWIQYKG